MKIMEVRDAYMGADAEGRAKILAKTYGLSRHQMWQHKQSGKWIVSHSGVEQIAAIEGIRVEYSTVVVEPQFVVLAARAFVDGVEVGQPTFGEASPKNTTQSYPVAMAEKRAFDRATLKAVLGVVGGHGGDFYSEEEADDFRKGSSPSPSPAAAKAATGSWDAALARCRTVEDINRTFKGVSAGMDRESDEYAALVDACATRKQEVES